jgi:hypothetical protein
MIGYHGGINVPLSNVRDSTWRRQYAWYPSSYTKDSFPDYARMGNLTRTVIPPSSLPTEYPLTSVTWTINGRRTRLHGAESADIALVAGEAVDRALEKPPEAFVDLTVSRSKDSVKVSVMVDSVVGKSRRLALRIVLMEDTVRLRGGTNRRLYSNVLRDHAVTPELPLGLPLAAAPARTVHTFDIAKLREELSAQRDVRVAVRFVYPAEKATDNVEFTKSMFDRFPDARDWGINPDRLHVVAFVQDLETGDILQGAMTRVPPSGKTVREVR